MKFIDYNVAMTFILIIIIIITTCVMYSMLRGRSSFIFHLCDFGPFNSSMHFPVLRLGPFNSSPAFSVAPPANACQYTKFQLSGLRA